MRSATVTGKLIEYIHFAGTIAGKRDQRTLQISVKPCVDLRAMRMSDAISFVWVAGTFSEHLKVQYEL
jgi:hypothetical protein